MRILILIILINVSLFTSGQSYKVDSLKERLSKETKEDTIRANLLNQLAFELQKNNSELSSKYADEAFQLSGKLKYYQGKAYSLWIKGLLCNKKDKKQALDYFEQADKIAEVIKDNSNRSLYLAAIGNLKTAMGNSEEGIVFYNKALSMAESVNNKNQSAKCRINISMHKASKGNVLEAVTELQKIIRDSVEINDSSLLAKTYSNLATLNARSNNFVKGMEYYLKALNINEKINDKNAYILCLINIASLQAEHKDRTAALKTVNKALKLSKEQNNTAYMGLCYAVLGNLHVLSDKENALKYYHTALTFKGMSESQRATIYMRMGVIHTSSKEFDKADMYFQKALKIAMDNKYKFQLSGIYRRYSEYFLAKKDYKTAIKYAENAVAMATESNSSLNKEEALKQLSTIHEILGNTEKALALYKNHTSIRDSIFKENNLRKLALMESNFAFAQEREKYESDRARNEIMIRKHKQIISLLIFIILLTTILTAILFRCYKLKKKLHAVEIENMNKEIESNQKAMSMAQLKLVKNSERDNQTINSLEKIIEKTDGEGKQDISRLISNYKYETINTNWKEFETYFIELNSTFYNKLNKSYPDLTTNERKLCIFMRLNMSNKDITQITYQSEEALKKSRLRLRRKLNLERNTNLSSFIQSI